MALKGLEPRCRGQANRLPHPYRVLRFANESDFMMAASYGVYHLPPRGLMPWTLAAGSLMPGGDGSPLVSVPL